MICWTRKVYIKINIDSLICVFQSVTTYDKNQGLYICFINENAISSIILVFMFYSIFLAEIFVFCSKRLINWPKLKLVRSSFNDAFRQINRSCHVCVYVTGHKIQDKLISWLKPVGKWIELIVPSTSHPPADFLRPKFYSRHSIKCWLD